MTPEPGTGPASPTATLFSFGTLLDPAVQRHLFAREVPTAAAELAGHAVVEVAIDDPDVVAASGSAVHPGLVPSVRGSVPGGLLHLDAAQLAAADAYEVAAYVRRRVHTTAGEPAWAYLSAQPLQAACRIAVVGDSIAYGRSATDGGWAGALSRWHLERDEVEHRCYNLAYPGTTLERIHGHIHEELAARRVDTVVLAAGINDLILDHCDAERALARLAALCERMEAEGRRPVVMGPHWLDAAWTGREHGEEVDLAPIQHFRQELAAWAARTHRDHLDPWPVLEGRTELFTDGLHPGPEGHRLLSDWILGRATAPGL